MIIQTRFCNYAIIYVHTYFYSIFKGGHSIVNTCKYDI